MIHSQTIQGVGSLRLTPVQQVTGGATRDIVITPPPGAAGQTVVIQLYGKHTNDLLTDAERDSPQFFPGQLVRVKRKLYGLERGQIVCVDRLIQDKPGLMYVAGYSRMVDASKFEKVN